MTRGTNAGAHDGANPQDGQRPPPSPPLPRGVLIRCAADGELCPETRAQLQRHMCECPQDDACIRFEVQLKEACARVMCECAPPAELREAIVTRLSAGVAPGQVVVVGRIGWARRWGLAAAAVLAVGVGTTIIITTGLRTGTTANAAVVQLSSYLENEHDACLASSDALRRHLEITDPSAVPQRYRAMLGKPISTELMESADFRFVGAGSCAVPGAEKSAHLLFRRKDKDGTEGPLVSVFIEPDAARLGLAEGTTYAIKDGATRVYAWVSDGLVYYVVTKCSKSCAAARKELHAPANVAQLSR